MSSNTQINRRLTSIVATVVAISVIGQVEVRLPLHEVEIVAQQLEGGCRSLMSDRAGQQALDRLLRCTGSARQTHPACAGAKLLTGGAKACPFGLLMPLCGQGGGLVAVTISRDLLAPGITCRVRARSPSCRA